MTEILEKVKRKMEQLNNRIEIRRGLNHYDESKRLMILEERLGVYEDLLPDISFLITTIESLQKENRHLEQRMKENHSIAMGHAVKLDEQTDLLESQKEEIEKLNELVTLQRTELIDLYAWRENQ